MKLRPSPRRPGAFLSALLRVLARGDAEYAAAAAIAHAPLGRGADGGEDGGAPGLRFEHSPASLTVPAPRADGSGMKLRHPAVPPSQVLTLHADWSVDVHAANTLSHLTYGFPAEVVELEPLGSGLA